MVDRKNGSQPDQPALPVNNVQNNTPTPLGSETPNEKSGTSTATNGNGYYSAAGLEGSTPYPPLGYNDQAGNGGPADPSSQQNGTSGTPFDPTTGGAFPIYTTAGPVPAANITNPTLPSNATPTIGQTGTPAANPLIAFASQATQHVMSAGPDGQPGASQEEEWRRSNAAQAQAQQLLAATAHATGIVGGNPWHDWTAAIADSQERYSANALLTLGGGSGAGRPGDHVEGVGPSDALSAAAASLGIGLGVNSTHTGQWPLLLFHDGTGNSGGGG